MKYPLIISAALFFSAVFPGCHQSSKSSVQSNSTSISDTPVPFTPPPDSSITPDQFIAWFKCNPGLDSLAQGFTDSVKAKSVVICDSTQMAYLKAQDRICLSNGLRSGYTEYCWIRENAGTIRNRPLWDSLQGKYRKPL